MNALHFLELELIRKIHHVLRSTHLDTFFRAWDFFDRAAFIIILIPFVWFVVDRRIGIRLFYLLTLSAVINLTCKVFFGLPRPCHLSAGIAVLNYGTPGFPSGAAQTAAILSSLIIIECKREFLWILGLLFGLCLCFSRVYLGLHFFSDIIGGIIVGGFLVCIYVKVFPIIENKWSKWMFRQKILFICVLPSLISILTLYPELRKLIGYFGLSIGVGIGLLLDEKFLNIDINQRSLEKRLFCTICAIFGIFVANAIFSVLPCNAIYISGFFYLLPGIWLSFIVPFLFYYLEPTLK